MELGIQLVNESACKPAYFKAKLFKIHRAPATLLRACDSMGSCFTFFLSTDILLPKHHYYNHFFNCFVCKMFVCVGRGVVVAVGLGVELGAGAGAEAKVVQNHRDLRIGESVAHGLVVEAAEAVRDPAVCLAVAVLNRLREMEYDWKAKHQYMHDRWVGLAI